MLGALGDRASCEYCEFSIQRLRQMAERGGSKEMFQTFGRRARMNIYEVNTATDSIVMRRSTGTLTNMPVKRLTDTPGQIKQLKISSLIYVHDLIHSGQIALDPHEIDELGAETFMWGNYIAGLLRHLGCRKIA